MNKKQLAFLQTILTTEQLTQLLALKVTKPKKSEETIEKKQKPKKEKCEANKKNKEQCDKSARNGEHYCGTHLKTIDKVANELATSVIEAVM